MKTMKILILTLAFISVLPNNSRASSNDEQIKLYLLNTYAQTLTKALTSKDSKNTATQLLKQTLVLINKNDLGLINNQRLNQLVKANSNRGKLSVIEYIQNKVKNITKDKKIPSGSLDESSLCSRESFTETRCLGSFKLLYFYKLKNVLEEKVFSMANLYSDRITEYLSSHRGRLVEHQFEKDLLKLLENNLQEDYISAAKNELSLVTYELSCEYLPVRCSRDIKSNNGTIKPNSKSHRLLCSDQEILTTMDLNNIVLNCK